MNDDVPDMLRRLRNDMLTLLFACNSKLIPRLEYEPESIAT